MDIPKSRQSPLGSHCGGVYTPEIVTQEGLTFVNTHLRVVISRVNMGSNDEKMAGFARRDVSVTQNTSFKFSYLIWSWRFFFVVQLSLRLFFFGSASWTL